MSDKKLTVRPNGPCRTCPYRMDVPSGIWAEAEYEKLRGYDGEITDQAVAGASGVFMCHQVAGDICAGWAGCHDMPNTFAARLNAKDLDESVWDYESPVPLFGSGSEAASHGEAEIDDKSDEAEDAISKIVRVREARGVPVKFTGEDDDPDPFGDDGDDFPIVCENGCPEGHLGHHKFSCSLARSGQATFTEKASVTRTGGQLTVSKDVSS